MEVVAMEAAREVGRGEGVMVAAAMVVAVMAAVAMVVAVTAAAAKAVAVMEVDLAAVGSAGGVPEVGLGVAGSAAEGLAEEGWVVVVSIRIGTPR
jgi:hypothetical protein